MFDFSFGEIFVIAVVAVIFLGPDKLPQTFVKIAKFLRAVKKTINDAKDTLDREIHITEMKQDALEYKKKFADSAEKLKNEILQDADVEGIKREIEGAKSAAILNESLEKSSISFDEVENRGKAMQKRLKNNLKQKNAESVLDSAKSQNLIKNNPVRSTQNSPASWCKKSESKGAVVPPADFLLEAEKRGTPPKSEKRQLLARRGSGEGGAALLREKTSENDGKGFAESIKESQSGLPRRFCESARNDEILDSSLRLRSAQNDKNSVRVAESSKKPKKSALDSAKAKSKTIKKSPRKRAKANGSN